jgi:predicted alpha/beta-fold hydrolase
MNRGRRFYHSGETADLSQVVTWLLTERPGVPILLAGVSLGGNVLLKWLGEQGDALPPEVAGAVAISVPFDLARSSRKIGAGFSRLYERVFLSTLRAKALHIRERFPDLLSGVDIGRISSMWEFDDVVTAPVHGFENADDYYARCSSIRWIARIRVPTLLLSAADDPFLPPEVLAGVQRIADENHFLRTEFPERGGHVGFIGGKNPFRPYYYAEWRACAFLEQPGPGLRRENAQITDIG